MIVLADYSTLCWKLHTKYKKLEELLGENHPDLEQYGKLLWARLLNAAPRAINIKKGYKLIILLDVKSPEMGGYWRNYLMRVDTLIRRSRKPNDSLEYKGKRKEKQDSFLKLYGIGLSYCEKVARFPIFGFPGFEADDWAGEAVRLFKASKKTKNIPSDTPLVLWTVDRDWAQLVDDEYNISFANTRPPTKNSDILVMWEKEQDVINYFFSVLNIEINHPNEIANKKAFHGDPSDNIPKGSIYADFYIDLLSPAPLPFLDLMFVAPTLYKNLEKELKVNIEPNTNMQHLIESRKILEECQFSQILVEDKKWIT